MMKYLSGSSARPLPINTCSMILLVPGPRVPSWEQDGVVLGGIERTESHIGELAVANSTAFLQFEIADFVKGVRAVYLLRIIAVGDHHPLDIVGIGASNPSNRFVFLGSAKP